LIGRKPVNLIVGWCGRFLFFVVPCQFSQDTGEWPENQILIPDWTYFHCPGARCSLNKKYIEMVSETQVTDEKKSLLGAIKSIPLFSSSTEGPWNTPNCNTGMHA